MRKVVFFIGLIQVLVCSCAVSNTMTIDRNAEQLEVAAKEFCKDTQYFKSTKLVRLETTDESQIRNINRILSDDNKLFVYDRMRRSVFVFEDTGKFLYSICTVGLGPREYREVYDVCLDTRHKRLMLYCDLPYKVFIYDYAGKFIEEKNIHASDGFMSQLTYENERWYGLDIVRSRFVNTFDEKTMEVECLMENPVFKKNVYVIPDGRFITQNRGVTFSNRFENYIYEINRDGIKSKYYIDFNDLNFPDVYLEDDVPSDDLKKICGKNEYVYSIINIHNNEKYLAFATNQPGFYIYSKQDKILKRHPAVFSTQYNISSGRILNVDYSDNQVAFIVSTDYLYRMKGLGAELSQNTIDLLNEVKEDDNDLLMICEFR